MISRTSAALTLALGLATPLAAQNAATYRRNPGDTLRYRQVTEATTEPNGESHLDATVVLAFGAGDTARAWYETYNFTGKMGGRDLSVPAERMVNQPWTLLVGANGSVQVLSGPAGAGAGMGPGAGAPRGRGQMGPRAGGATGGFAQFLFELPERPLTVGAEWADTLENGKMDQPDGGKVESQHIVKYKVAKDTTFGGGKAVVITWKGDNTRKMTRTTDRGASEMRTRTAESGRAVFATDLGRMVSLQSDAETTVRSSSTGNEGFQPMTGGNRGDPMAGRGRGLPAGPGGMMGSQGRRHESLELIGPETLKAAPTK